MTVTRRRRQNDDPAQPGLCFGERQRQRWTNGRRHDLFYPFSSTLTASRDERFTEAFRAGEAGFDIGSLSLSLPRGAQEIGLGVLMALVLIFRPEGIMGGRELPFPFRARRPKAPVALTRVKKSKLV